MRLLALALVLTAVPAAAGTDCSRIHDGYAYSDCMSAQLHDKYAAQQQRLDQERIEDEQRDLELRTQRLEDAGTQQRLHDAMDLDK